MCLVVMCMFTHACAPGSIGFTPFCPGPWLRGQAPLHHPTEQAPGEQA